MIIKPCKSMVGWSMNMRTETDVFYMPALFNFTMRILEDVFGTNIMMRDSNNRVNMHFDVSESDGKWLEILIDPYVVRTNTLNQRNWAGYIWQLGYGLTQHTLRSANLGVRGKIYWFEHAVCCAVAQYVLDVAMAKWNECPVSQENPDYGIEATERFMGEDTIENIPPVVPCLPDVLSLFHLMPYDIKAVVQYSAFTSMDNDDIDFEAWLDSNDYRFPDKYRTGDHKDFIKRLGHILYDGQSYNIEECDDEDAEQRAYWENYWSANGDEEIAE